MGPPTQTRHAEGGACPGSSVLGTLGEIGTPIGRARGRAATASAVGCVVSSSRWSWGLGAAEYDVREEKFEQLFMTTRTDLRDLRRHARTVLNLSMRVLQLSPPDYTCCTTLQTKAQIALNRRVSARTRTDCERRNREGTKKSLKSLDSQNERQHFAVRACSCTLAPFELRLNVISPFREPQKIVLALFVL
jgi:hypothetical protein